MTEREIQVPEELAQRLDALQAAGQIDDQGAFVAEAVAARLHSDKERALASIRGVIPGGEPDPGLLQRALGVLGRSGGSAPHAGAA